MEKKEEIIDTLEFLSQELLREKFRINRLKRKKKQLEIATQKTRQKLAEILTRINYNLDKHGKTIREELGDDSEK